ncbi:Immune-responsive protein 1 [Amycolatopsis camponoti]|uniref:Immune-responsive protein 1 n=1 Tax=Amycolatopsis camponoti TaxID=2606593 RepID=A0A6I8M249_9PSEU|nr:MmgE/PrpD family protein [Amycolatopsis camponoti]VVJ21589.1 Immune-responsive protein 1 [Amycolatopsis camponoti]
MTEQGGTSPRDILHDLAEFASRTEYRRLPESAVEGAKKSILDTLGVILAASGLEPAISPVIELVRETGGRAEASVLGFRERAPAIMAAFANGAMAHCLDFDDQTPWGQHAASSIIPAVFAVAERRGGVSGEDLIAGVAVGQDIFARFRRGIDWRKDWNFSTAMGVFAATAAASRVIGLPPERIAAALSIASTQSAGVMETVFGTGSDLHGLYAGFSAKGAVLATLLAHKGTTGVSTLFEGEHGVLNTYFGGRYDRESILKDLGEVYLGGTTLYKFWPSVGTSHGHIHATIQVLKEQALSVDDIREIRVYVGDHHNLMCRPLDLRRAPVTAVDAKFSLPFLVAVAAVRGTVVVSDFADRARRDPEVLAAAQKVLPITDSSLDWKFDMLPGRVEIVTQDGRSFTKTGDGLPGSPEAPMTWSQVAEKFGSCAAAAAVPPAAEQIREAQEMARALESQVDATTLVRGLALS